MSEGLLDDGLPTLGRIVELLQLHRHAEIGEVVARPRRRPVDQQPGLQLDPLPLIETGRQRLALKPDVAEQAHPVVGVHLADGLPGARHGVAHRDEILILEGKPTHLRRRDLAHIELAAIGPHQDHRRRARLALDDEGDLLHAVIDAKAVVEQWDVGGGKHLVGHAGEGGQQQQPSPERTHCRHRQAPPFFCTRSSLAS